jgi:hypothetical protein
MKVWMRIINWLGMVYTLPQSCISLLNSFAAVSGKRNQRQGQILIWNSVIWELWRQRNRMIFENATLDLGVVVDAIKVASWKWWVSRANSQPCLLYEWYQEPLCCLSR